MQINLSKTRHKANNTGVKMECLPCILNIVSRDFKYEILIF